MAGLAPVSDELPAATLARPSVIDRLRSFGHPEIFALLSLVIIGALTYLIVTSDSQQDNLLTPALVAALMVLNLVPAMALIVLIGSRIARSRAAHSLVGGNGRLHVRLVALFSMTAAVPTLLVAIFASILFQSGVDFWFSERSRGMFENAANLAQGYYEENQKEVGANTLAMANDIRTYLERVPVDSEEFSVRYLQQVVVRNLNGSAVIQIGSDGVARTLAMIDPDNRTAENRITPSIKARLDAGQEVVITTQGDRIEAATRVTPNGTIYLYASRDSQVLGLNHLQRARTVLADYNALLFRSQQLQLRFNLALYFGSLVLLGVVVAAAILVADRIVRPVGDLVAAARTAGEGDLSVRVAHGHGRRSDEIGVLAQSFNAMAERLERQTLDLVQANQQEEARRTFIETVLGGVSAGVISLTPDRRIRLANESAERLLGLGRSGDDHPALAAVAPQLDAMLDSQQHDAIVQLATPGEPRTVAVRMVALGDGHVVTFEDITQQLLDQRRAAWADVARRIAHEIKNPLTPIQLAAERLQRRYGDAIDNDPATFRKLTATIIRQVGDMRRMVDEFSAFARGPKPSFGPEDLLDIIRKAVFLQEVASPSIRFDVMAPDSLPPLVCDRRLLSQVLTNVLKNAVEAIEEKPDRAPGALDVITVTVTADGPRLEIAVADTGRGLPPERDRIVEPYMTTRKGGTGLGLAIVKKIVEDHFGEIRFADRPGGGAVVRMMLNTELLAPLAGLGGTHMDGEDQEPSGRAPHRALSTPDAPIA